mmetsp:Transcript_43276/g.78784  ORF Transcript_43276/g.78784 Transcript_43276/m.78784 type:complete len:187 (-) Transcript_43276:393-953(-)
MGCTSVKIASPDDSTSSGESYGTAKRSQRTSERSQSVASSRSTSPQFGPIITAQESATRAIVVNTVGTKVPVPVYKKVRASNLLEADDDEADQPAFEHYQSMRCHWMLEDHKVKRPLPPDAAMHYAHARELQHFLVAVKQDPQDFANRVHESRLNSFGDCEPEDAHVCEMPQSRPVRWANEIRLSV